MPCALGKGLHNAAMPQMFSIANNAQNFSIIARIIPISSAWQPGANIGRVKVTSAGRSGADLEPDELWLRRALHQVLSARSNSWQPLQGAGPEAASLEERQQHCLDVQKALLGEVTGVQL